jgi:putative phosphoribosyl transferase
MHLVAREKVAVIRGEPIFHNRRDAGRQLAAVLRRLRGADPVVLALPRGGVPVAFEIAKALEAPLDVVLVRKIGAPGHEEFALGAVVDGVNPQLVLNAEIVERIPLEPGYFATAAQRQLAEIERRRRLYRGSAAAADIRGRAVILVDDGIATGASVKAALRGVRRNQPRRLVLAVPVAPPEALDALATECDEVVCLSTPEPFYAVGLYYGDFTQTTDAEVIALLAEARQD